MSSIRRCLFCKCLLSADRDGLCIVSYQQKAGSMYLGDLTEESDSLLVEEREDRGVYLLKALQVVTGCPSLCPHSQFCMSVQEHPTNTEFSPS